MSNHATINSNGTSNDNSPNSSETNCVSLRIGLFNVENLFLLFDQQVPAHFEKLNEIQWQRLSNSVYENKSLKKTIEIAKIILEEKPDIMMLCEVGGEESLKNFNHFFLKNDFDVFLVEGNSDRNIDIGFLVRNNSPFISKINSNKHRKLNFLYPHEALSKKTGYPVGKESQLFSRDCAELHLFTNGQADPFIIFMLAHLKSRLDPEKIDPGGVERRTAELQACIEIYKELTSKYPNTPIIFSGDMNGYAGRNSKESEFSIIYNQTDLSDIFEITNLGLESRSTYYQIKNGGYADGKQIDYCFIPASLQSHINHKISYVYRFKDEFGFPLSIPNNLLAKSKLPSDHYPIFFTLENIKTK